MNPNIFNPNRYFMPLQNTPQFPKTQPGVNFPNTFPVLPGVPSQNSGSAYGMQNLLPGNVPNPAALKNFTNNQIKYQGFKLPVSVGVNAFNNLQLPEAAMLLGMAFQNLFDPSDQFTIAVGNEDVARDVGAGFATLGVGIFVDNYFALNRFVSTNSPIKLTYNANVANPSLMLTFYYQ